MPSEQGSGGAKRSKLRFKGAPQRTGGAPKKVHAVQRESDAGPRAPPPQQPAVSWPWADDASRLDGPVSFRAQTGKPLAARAPLDDDDAAIGTPWTIEKDASDAAEPADVEHVVVAQRLLFQSGEAAGKAAGTLAGAAGPKDAGGWAAAGVTVALKHPLTGRYLEVVPPGGVAAGAARVAFRALAISPACEFEPFFPASGTGRPGAVALSAPFLAQRAWLVHNVSEDSAEVTCRLVPTADDGPPADAIFRAQYQSRRSISSASAAPDSAGGSLTDMQRLQAQVFGVAPLISRQRLTSNVPSSTLSKKYQSWGYGQTRVAPGASAELERAKQRGALQSALLDSRARQKSDKYCK